jgi:hypothetical protein
LTFCTIPLIISCLIWFFTQRNASYINDSSGIKVDSKFNDKIQNYFLDSQRWIQSCESLDEILWGAIESSLPAVKYRPKSSLYSSNTQKLSKMYNLLELFKVHIPYLETIITDTHFGNQQVKLDCNILILILLDFKYCTVARDRMGRMLTFVGRILQVLLDIFKCHYALILLFIIVTLITFLK